MIRGALFRRIHRKSLSTEKAAHSPVCIVKRGASLIFTV